MKITRLSGTFVITWEIDFSRELKFYDMEVGDSKIDHGICVPVVPGFNGMSLRDETYFWDSYVGVKVIVDDDSYTLDEGNPKEYARLVNNLETLFALYGLK